MVRRASYPLLPTPRSPRRRQTAFQISGAASHPRLRKYPHRAAPRRHRPTPVQPTPGIPVVVGTFPYAVKKHPRTSRNGSIQLPSRRFVDVAQPNRTARCLFHQRLPSTCSRTRIAGALRGQMHPTHPKCVLGAVYAAHQGNHYCFARSALVGHAGQNPGSILHANAIRTVQYRHVNPPRIRTVPMDAPE